MGRGQALHPFFRLDAVGTLTAFEVGTMTVKTAMTWRAARGLCGAALILVAACAQPSREPRTPAPEPERPERPEEPARDGPLRIGVILPEGGTAQLRQYSQQVRVGLDIAFRDLPQDIEVLYVDDRGDEAEAVRHTRELEEQGVVAILGPLLGAAVDAAAAARADESLVLISPTASERPTGRNAFTLNAGDARGGEALARYALTRGHTNVALLYPAGAEFRDQVAAFRSGIEQGGGRIVSDIAWEPGTTTFAEPLERLRASRAAAVFIAAAERDIRQLAPQLAYYGVGGMQVLGTEAWASEAVIARLEPAMVEGVVAAVPFLATSPAVAWDEFVGLYEAAERRSLDNPYPALGWDAARLVLDAIGSDRSPSRRDIAERLSDIESFRGATGVLSLTGGTVTRQPFLVRVRNGRAEPIPDIQR